MIFAFTSPDSQIPHFTLDSVMMQEGFAFHLDLIPRVDLGANLDYIMDVFNPLDAVFAEANQIEGLTPAEIPLASTPTLNAVAEIEARVPNFILFFSLGLSATLFSAN